MAQVNFYLLKENYLDARNSFACRFIDKIWQQGRSIYVYLDSREKAEHFNDLLWTFRDDSFIPHMLLGEVKTITPPIQIGYQSPSSEHNDILINLSNQTPEFYSQFHTVVEVVPNNPELRAQARSHYRTYRNANNTLRLYDLST